MLELFLRLFSKLAKAFLAGFLFWRSRDSIGLWHLSTRGVVKGCFSDASAGRIVDWGRKQVGVQIFSDIDSARPPKIMSLQASVFFNKWQQFDLNIYLQRLCNANFYLKQVKPKAILPIRKLRQGNSGNSSHREIWWGWASQIFYRDSPGFGGGTSPAAMGARHLLGKVLHLHAHRPLRWDKREFWRKLKKVHVEDYHSIWDAVSILYNIMCIYIYIFMHILYRNMKL